MEVFFTQVLRGYVIVNVRAWLVPPPVQPRLPDVPLGVLMATLAVAGPAILAAEGVSLEAYVVGRTPASRLGFP